MFRRFMRSARPGLALSDEELRKLTPANTLLANGRPAEAAGLYAQLAQELESANHPRRAANLHAQAAHASIDSKNEAQALNQARAALNLFGQYRMDQRFSRFYTNIDRRLRSQGMNAAANQLENEFSGSLRAAPQPTPAPVPSQRGRLPGACPHCGAPVRSDEVDWIDDRSAECLFCGATLSAGT